MFKVLEAFVRIYLNDIEFLLIGVMAIDVFRSMQKDRRTINRLPKTIVVVLIRSTYFEAKNTNLLKYT